jgi:murein DD-endopeptidase MepM/ murein hydrolase activator NlpD
MECNQKLFYSKTFLLLIFSGFFISALPSCTTSSLSKSAKNKQVSSSNSGFRQTESTARFLEIDTSKVLVYLDTTQLGFCFPIHGKVISPYGKRGSRMHTGTDIKLAKGDEVRAVFKGTVTKASTYYGYGILVVIKHSRNVETYYAHLSKALVNVGDEVEAGTVIGLGGRTGRATTEHLHFEIRNNGKALNAEHFFNFNELYVKTLVLERSSSKDKEEDVSVPKSEKSEKVVAAKTEKYHTVRKGDTLYSISKKHGTSVEHICKLNSIKKSTVLAVGKKLRVN